MSAAETTRPIDVDEALAMAIEQFGAIAWQKLGLQPDPLTGQTSRDLPQARVAVDAVAALAGVLEPRLDDEDRRQVQNLVRDLRVNYVQKAEEAKA